jgi:malate/lactate dehydrogenase
VKVALFGGAGGVGASAAFNLLLDGAGHEVVILDTRPEMTVSHVMDLQQVLEQGATGSVRAGDASDLGDVDVLVICASYAEQVTGSRRR